MAMHNLEIVSIFGTVAMFFVRYVALPMLAKSISDWLKPRIAKSEVELIHWMHWEKKAQGIGHRYKSVAACPDESCAKVVRQR